MRQIRLISASAGLSCRLKMFVRDGGGATAVEFAMVSVPFIGILFAIFETAFVFFNWQGVEAATDDAARYIMTGQAATGNYSSSSNFRDNVICNPTTPRVRILPSFIDCSTLIMDVNTAGNSGSTTFSSAVVSNAFYTNSTQKYCIGQPGDIVVLRIVYPMPAYLDILTLAGSIGKVSTSTNGLTNFNGGLKHILLATAVFRNEPFTAGTLASGCS